MKKQTYLIFVTGFLSLLIIGVLVYSCKPKPKLNVIWGEADFSNFDITDTSIINGQWQVFRDQLIATDNININGQPVEYVNLPYQDTFNFNKYGYASYRVLLKNVPTNEEIMVILNGINDGYNLYFNRELVYTNNRLKKGDNLVKFDFIYHPYYNTSSDLEIIIEVSNYSFNYTGLQKTPLITTNIVYQRNVFYNLAVKVFLIGSLFFAILYQLLVIGFRNYDKGALYFSLVCICGVISIITYKSTYSYVIETLLNIKEKLIITAHFVSMYLATGFIFLAFNSSFKKSKSTKFGILILLLVGVTSILPLLFAIRIFSGIRLVFNAINLITIALIFIWSLKQINKNYLNKYISVIISLIFIGSVYDTLIDVNIIPYSEKISYLIFLVSIIIFSAISAFKREMELSNVQEIIRLNAKIRDTEFTFLNTQIQSHFIYNTLNSIQALCNTNPSKAGELIEDFSTYLRTRLEFNKMPYLIDIEDELENIRTYLNIEKVRFENRVNYEYDLKVGAFKIPPLTVQPLVENAVKHGISKKKGGGTILIATYEDEDYIYIAVNDNGLGFDPTSLSEKQRVGTENIHLRLALHLNAQLLIDSKVDVGTTAIIKIPHNWKETYEANKERGISNN